MNDWWSWPSIRRALLRGLFTGPAFPVVASVALIEAWATSRPRTKTGEVAILALAFVVASVGFVVCWFQPTYFGALHETGSMSAALERVGHEAAKSIWPAPVGGQAQVPTSIYIVWLAEGAALALTGSIALRRFARVKYHALGMIVVIAPQLDWIVLFGLRHEVPHGTTILVWIFQSVVSSFLLGLFGIACAGILEILRFLADAVDDWRAGVTS